MEMQLLWSSSPMYHHLFFSLIQGLGTERVKEDNWTPEETKCCCSGCHQWSHQYTRAQLQRWGTSTSYRDSRALQWDFSPLGNSWCNHQSFPETRVTQSNLCWDKQLKEKFEASQVTRNKDLKYAIHPLGQVIVRVLISLNVSSGLHD